MNLITPEIRRAAADEIKTGRSFVLSLPLDVPSASLHGSRRPPKLFAVEAERGGYYYRRAYSHDAPGATDFFSDDSVTLSTQHSTQWDALCHVAYCFDVSGSGVEELVYYNGFRDQDIMQAPTHDDGPKARSLGIERLAETGAQGRGVLVDLHAVYGRASLTVGYDDLMSVFESQRIKVEKGDFLCLYTGMADAALEMGASFTAQYARGICAGLNGRDERLLRWIADSGLVAICADNTAVEKSGLASPGAPNPGPALPLHRVCLFELGIHLGELWYFSALARWLRENGRTTFFLTAPPLRLPGAVGSPVTPVATV